MQKINAAQLATVLASMGITVEGSANAAVAPTAKVRRTAPATKPANTAPYSLVQGNYQGHPTITFTRDGSRPVSMGYAKIRLVLAHADALRKIVGA